VPSFPSAAACSLPVAASNSARRRLRILPSRTRMGAVGPRTAGTTGDGMEYEEGGVVVLGEGLLKLPPLTLKRPLVTSCDGLMVSGSRDKRNHAVSYSLSSKL